MLFICTKLYLTCLPIIHILTNLLTHMYYPPSSHLFVLFLFPLFFLFYSNRFRVAYFFSLLFVSILFSFTSSTLSYYCLYPARDSITSSQMVFIINLAYGNMGLFTFKMHSETNVSHRITHSGTTVELSCLLHLVYSRQTYCYIC